MEVGYRVYGLNRAVRALNKAGANSEDMRDLMHEVGEVVAERARELAPKGKTHRLASSIRAGRGKTKAVIRAGYERKTMRYAGVINYGWPSHNLSPRPFMTQALNERKTQALSTLSEGLNEILRNADLI